MTSLLAPADQAEFRLLRMILLDSYSPGGEAIIVLRNGAIMTGENGSGKTSLIRLVPIFFGENPGRVNVGTEGFVSFYLARTTSYIIFEYARRDVICQAVLYAGQEDSYGFRFVRSGYDLSHYTGADGKSLIQNHALSTHLKTLGVSHSRALALSEYRAIIQGRHGAGKDAALQRAYVNEYAFTSSNHRLDHIDKIVSGMFKRQADFNAFLRMVVSYITEEDRPIVVSGDRNRIGKWPEHYAAYQEVMRHGERMGEINTISARLTANDNALAVLHAKFLVLIEHHEKQRKQLLLAHTDANTEFEEAEQKHKGKIEGIRSKELAAAGEAKLASETAAALRRQAEEYQAQGISGKAAIVAALEQNRATADELGKRKEILLGTKTDVDQKYARLILDVDKEYLATQSATNKQTLAIDASFAPRFAELLDAQRADEQSHRDLTQAAQAEAQEALNLAIAEEARWKAIAANPPASPESEEALKLKRGALVAARTVLKEADGALKRANTAKGLAITGFQHHERIVKDAEGRVENQQAAISEFIASANPPAESLLRFLREHRPGWADNIAKVINPELLLLCNLSPSMIEADPESLYGLSLDLSRIHTPIFADEAQIQKEIEAARRTLEDLQRAHTADVKQLSVLNDVRAAAQTEYQKNEGEFEKALLADETLTTEELGAIRAVEESKRSAKEEAAHKAAIAGTSIGGLSTSLKNLQTQLGKDLKSVEETYKGRTNALNAEKAGLVEQLTAALAKAALRKTARVEELNRERDDVLAKEGVDTAKLQEMERGIAAAEQGVRESSEWAERVAAWQLWSRNDWPRTAKLAEEALEHHKKEKQHLDARTKADKAWAEWSGHERKRMTAMADGAERSRLTAQETRTKLVRIDDFPPDQATLGLHYESSWTNEELVGQLNQLLSNRRVSEGDLKNRIREIKIAFRNGHGSPTEQYFEMIAASIDPDDDNHRAWIEPLRQWYDGRHDEFLRTLLLEAQSFGRLVNRFHSDVLDFDNQIKSFNRSMRTALDQTVVFRRISQISIEFVSTVDQKAYWKPIKDFVDTHHAWITSLGRELPPPSFSDGLKRLMEQWEVREGIRADRLSLIDVRGEVVENGKMKAFVDGPSLKELSSNGLSYLILTTICVAFLRMIRGDAKVQLTMAVDELLDLDVRNIGILVQMLRENGIDLVSACPDADVDVMMHFENRYKVVRDESGPEIHQAELDDDEVSCQ